jgi:hypothetical protein
LNFFTISDNIWSIQSLEAYPTKGRPLSHSEIQSPIPKQIGSRILENEARAIESRINAPYLPKSTKPTAFTSPAKDHTQSSQYSLVSTLEKLGLDTAIPSSGCPTDSRCICGRYGKTGPAIELSSTVVARYAVVTCHAPTQKKRIPGLKTLGQ